MLAFATPGRQIEKIHVIFSLRCDQAMAAFHDTLKMVTRGADQRRERRHVMHWRKLESSGKEGRAAEGKPWIDRGEAGRPENAAMGFLGLSGCPRRERTRRGDWQASLLLAGSSSSTLKALVISIAERVER